MNINFAFFCLLVCSVAFAYFEECVELLACGQHGGYLDCTITGSIVHLNPLLVCFSCSSAGIVLSLGSRATSNTIPGAGALTLASLFLPYYKPGT